MEPQWMILGHAAGTAADIAISSGQTVQEIDIHELQSKLQSQGAILVPPISRQSWYAWMPMFSYNQSHPLILIATKTDSLLKRARSIPSKNLPHDEVCHAFKGQTFKLTSNPKYSGDEYWQVELQEGQSCPP